MSKSSDSGPRRVVDPVTGTVTYETDHGDVVARLRRLSSGDIAFLGSLKGSVPVSPGCTGGYTSSQ